MQTHVVMFTAAGQHPPHVFNPSCRVLIFMMNRICTGLYLPVSFPVIMKILIGAAPGLALQSRRRSSGTQSYKCLTSSTVCLSLSRQMAVWISATALRGLHLRLLMWTSTEESIMSTGVDFSWTSTVAWFHFSKYFLIFIFFIPTRKHLSGQIEPQGPTLASHAVTCTCCCSFNGHLAPKLIDPHKSSC